MGVRPVRDKVGTGDLLPASGWFGQSNPTELDMEDQTQLCITTVLKNRYLKTDNSLILAQIAGSGAVMIAVQFSYIVIHSSLSFLYHNI